MARTTPGCHAGDRAVAPLVFTPIPFKAFGFVESVVSIGPRITEQGRFVSNSLVGIVSNIM